MSCCASCVDRPAEERWMWCGDGGCSDWTNYYPPPPPEADGEPDDS